VSANIREYSSAFGRMEEEVGTQKRRKHGPILSSGKGSKVREKGGGLL